MAILKVLMTSLILVVLLSLLHTLNSREKEILKILMPLLVLVIIMSVLHILNVREKEILIVETYILLNRRQK